MPENNKKKYLIFIIVVLAIISIVTVASINDFSLKTDPEKTAVKESAQPKIALIPIKPPKVIDFNEIYQNGSLSDLMEMRKEAYGIEQSVDVIAKSDETLKIGKTTISMKEILDEIKLNQDTVIETDIDPSAPTAENRDSYGIYVVQKGDNIWNIHFKFLRNYMSNQKVHVSTLADEPNQTGRSSGVGKILKFSEKMVYIYNIKERKLSVDLDVIEPNSKIIVYNMKEVYSLLSQVNYDQVDRIEFDGETIWIPPEQ